MPRLRFLLLALTALSLAATPAANAQRGRSHRSTSGSVHVRSYRTRSGTVVRSYNRRAPGQARTQADHPD